VIEPDGDVDSKGEKDADMEADADALGDGPCMKSIFAVRPL
jgi:hypothetical protein